jgi:hypothetical protein
VPAMIANFGDYTGDEITLETGRVDHDLAGSPALSLYVVNWPEVSLMRILRLIKSVFKNKLGRERDGWFRVRSDQCSGPGGVLFASSATAAVIRRQVVAPS